MLKRERQIIFFIMHIDCILANLFWNSTSILSNHCEMAMVSSSICDRVSIKANRIASNDSIVLQTCSDEKFIKS